MLANWGALPAHVRVFVSLCVALEAFASSGYLIGAADSVRHAMTTLGGFWPRLLSDAPPLYAGQSIVMFATSAFLHGGPLHLFMNMFALMWLGPVVVNRLGEQAFWPIAGLSALGAGGLFAMLSTSSVPMVGASGVLFGLIGAIATWELLDRLDRGQDLKPIIEQALVFAALNVALTLMSGMIAWQAHAGGLIAGVICGILTWSRKSRSKLEQI
ncbi:MAG: rhomboid family intramembrane serine protease [Pseudomonadota bacterium]